tara:strand:+ start:888 stop:1424 length:537 start_codon:yes stop_codon:yes gene_type:complete
MPVMKKKRSGQKIYETEMIDPERAWGKTIKTFRNSYSKAPFSKEVISFLEEEVKVETNLLSDFNLNFIEKMTRRLGNEELEILKCSDFDQLKASENVQTDLIVEVCAFFEVEKYISGTGCLSFLEEEKFKQSNVAISFQNYDHPTYKQAGTDSFMPGLSIIDSLMNVGFDGVSRILLK